MKSLKEILESSVLDIDTTLAQDEHDIILSKLFSTNPQQRREAFDDLLSLVESHRPNRCTSTAKMKNSDSYFVEFNYPIKVENGELGDICDWIGYIVICKRNGSNYRIACIQELDGRSDNKISIYELSWNYARFEFNPKASYTKVYEVPDKLNDLFERIQMKAYNYK